MVNINDLKMALEFTSSGSYSNNEAYIDCESGQVIYVSDFVDEEPPADLYENEKYRLLPTKQDLDLGKPLAFEFTRETMNDLYNEVCSIFSAEGAYSRFKSLLDRKGLLEQWYSYEEDRVINTLKKWCDGYEISYL